MSHFVIIVIGGNAEEKMEPHEFTRKYDWYTMGGRWRGFLKLKDGSKGEVGEPGIFDNPPSYSGRGVDSAKVCDIDWEGMYRERFQRLDRQWEIVREEKPVEKSDENVFGERDYNHILEYGLSYLKTYAISKCLTKKEYCKGAKFSTYAIVTEDGEWRCEDDKQEEATMWKEIFWTRFISILPSETLITVFDCHI